MKVIMGSIEDIDEGERKEIHDCVEELDKGREILYDVSQKQDLIKEKTSQPQKLELKELPAHLKYDFLAENGEKPIIISNSLTTAEEEEVVKGLKSNKGAIGWTIFDLTGISPSYCMHKIHMEQDFKLVAQPQRRLNPTMKEVVKKEVQKLLEAGMIYPLSDSA